MLNEMSRPCDASSGLVYSTKPDCCSEFPVSRSTPWSGPSGSFQWQLGMSPESDPLPAVRHGEPLCGPAPTIHEAEPAESPANDWLYNTGPATVSFTAAACAGTAATLSPAVNPAVIVAARTA